MDTRFRDLNAPLAITMWDFSWLERRWPGAGYEDWDQALDELTVRGYNAVRIDAYPHLIAREPNGIWELFPEWNQHDRGSPARNTVQVQPALNQFIAKCADRGIAVGLSTWWRDDQTKTHCQFSTPRGLADVWIATLQSIEQAGLLQQILYVDLSNEFPIPSWTPYLSDTKQWATAFERYTPWMAESIALVRTVYPQLPYTFSFVNLSWAGRELPYFDFLEPHIWMVGESDFYQQIGYNLEAFDPVGYETIVARAEPLYRQKPEYWQGKLHAAIRKAADWSRSEGKPLITTESWGSIVYKDWPGLDWGWIKELCALGVLQAAESGRWIGICTSNFCGPQYVGMWRDVEWHLRLTDIIKSASIDADLKF